MRFLPVNPAQQNDLHQKFYNSTTPSIHLFRPHVSRIMGLSYA
jgi:hypothetical protein